MSIPILLTVDMGTTNCKAVVTDMSGATIASAVRSYRSRGGRTGVREQFPLDWWHALVMTVRETLSQVPDPGAVIGLGLSGRGGGSAFLDRSGRALCSSWLDSRHADEAKHLWSLAASRAPWARGTASFGLASRALWLKTHHLAAFRKIAYLGGVKDYLVLRLTGRWATDASSGPPLGEWPYSITDQVGVVRAAFPEIVPIGDIVGGLSKVASEELGLYTGLPVSIGGHDGVCASIGSGRIRPGDACITLSTNAVLRITAPHLVDLPEGAATFSYRFVDGNWVCGGDVAAAGAFLQQLTALFRGSRRAQAALDQAASMVPPGSCGLTCLPFPAGMVSPESHTDLRAGFIGVTLAHEDGHFYRSVLEGVACTLRSIRDLFASRGLSIEKAALTGGGAMSSCWPSIIASTLEIPVLKVEPFESNRGAAILLSRALGLFSSCQEACMAFIRYTGEVVPEPELTKVYEDVWSTYKNALASMIAGG